MKKFLLLFIYVVLCSSSFSQSLGNHPVVGISVTKPSDCNGKRINIVPLSDHGRYLNSSRIQYSPGDTLVIDGKYNEWSYLTLDDIHGTLSCPVVVINEGLVKFNYSSIALNNCTYIKVTGAGDENHFYGFYMHDLSGPAVNVTGRSAYIEIERVQGYKTFGGAWLKQDPICDTKFVAGEVVNNVPKLFATSWYMDHVSLHDCKFTNIPFDVIYAGNTAPNGGRTITCNGVTKNYIPMRLSNFKIYNNIIDSAVRTGIQLSGANEGENEIFNNRVTRVGFEYNKDQGSGIIIGSSGHAYVHDNYIRQTWMYGIMALGSGYNRIEDNDIDSSGYLGKTINSSYQPTSIVVSATTSVPAVPVQVYIANNSLGKNATNKQIIIWTGKNSFDNGNIICNNSSKSGGSASMYVSPGVDYSTCNTSRQSSQTLSSSSDTTSSSLITQKNNFVDPSTHLYPNPVKDVLNLLLSSELKGDIMLVIYNAQGQIIQSKRVLKSTTASNESFNLQSLNAGTYFLQIQTENDKKMMKFVKN